jgi:ketosteroid isomerase-like protein
MAAPSVDEILGLERQFWEALQNNDATAAASLTDRDCLLIGAQGASTIHPDLFAAMMQNPGYVMERYEFDRGSVQFATVGDDVAVIAYRVTEQLTVGSEPIRLDAFDSSVWRRREGQWVCCSHTESIAGDPFGRDRRSA